MYWCKTSFNSLKLIFTLLICISGLAACRPDVQQSVDKRYFDLKKFIDADTARLNKANLTVNKTVLHNNSNEQTKQITIKNWGEELGLFSASDINKPAWRDSYKITNAGDSAVYTATDPHLVTRSMVVQTVNGHVKKISIANYTKNLLYQTTEQLVYYPDSLYIIDKLQKVKLIGSNRYLVKGLIKGL